MPNTAAASIPTQPTAEGQGVDWRVPVDVADEITAILAREVNTRQALGLETPTSLLTHLGTMQAAVESAIEEMIEEAFGCADLLPGAPAVTLDSPAIIGSASGGTLGVLLPGPVDTFEAASAAVQALRDADLPVDLDSEDLTAVVARPRWMVLHACTGNHCFHPEIAPEGRSTPGATLVTRVDFEI